RLRCRRCGGRWRRRSLERETVGARAVHPRENHGAVGSGQIARDRHVIWILYRQRKGQSQNVEMLDYRIVVGHPDHVLAHDRIQIAVLLEDRLDVGIPGRLGGRRRGAEHENADKIPEVADGLWRLLRQLISDAIELSGDVAARFGWVETAGFDAQAGL